MQTQVIHLHPAAPAKPAPGAACNGCGICCTAAPCPVGMLVSRRRAGACTALRWDEDARRYRCGLVSAPRAVWPWLPRIAARPIARLARRWISAATGCDSYTTAKPAAAR